MAIIAVPVVRTRTLFVAAETKMLQVARWHAYPAVHGILLERRGLAFLVRVRWRPIPNIGNNNSSLRSLKSPLSVEIFAQGDFREITVPSNPVEKSATLCVQRVPLCSKEISRRTGNARPQPRRANTPHCRRKSSVLSLRFVLA